MQYYPKLIHALWQRTFKKIFQSALNLGPSQRNLTKTIKVR